MQMYCRLSPLYLHYFLKLPMQPEALQDPAPVFQIPGAKQSVIYIGCPSMTRTDPDFYPAYVTNYKLGGSFNGLFNLILREEKGFTYGARSNFSGAKFYGTFMASSMVRTNGIMTCRLSNSARTRLIASHSRLNTSGSEI